MKRDTLTKLTSVKILKSLYEQFKFKTVNSSMNLQKLVNRSIHQYIHDNACLLYTSPSPRDKRQTRMPSSA